MKKIYMLLFTSVLMFITSCASISPIPVYSKKLKSVEIGMNKSEVIDIMGKGYNPIGAAQNSEGEIVETIKYEDAYNTFIFIFNNNSLVEWYEYIPHNNRPSTTTIIHETEK